MTRDTALVLLALLAATPGLARAHGRSVSYSSVVLDAEGARLRVRVPLLELTRLPEFLATGVAPQSSAPHSFAPHPAVADYFARNLRLATEHGPCAPKAPPQALAAAPGWVVHEWRVVCPDAETLALESELFLAEAPSHLHFARIRDGAGVRERVLSSASPRWLVREPAGKPGAGYSLPGYVALGVEHILSGADHLAFLLALILLAASVREVATLVTGFTLAHSVTLALAALGWLRPDATAVEALIGFSVALVAAENGWLLAGGGLALPAAIGLGLGMLALLAPFGFGALPAFTLAGLALFAVCHFALLQRARRPARLRVAIAFAFGLVHGFGFAGVLGELGLPRARLLPALFGFNLGVELGQLAIVALVWPALRALARVAGAGAPRLVAEVGSAGVAALGLFWFATRAYSLAY